MMTPPFLLGATLLFWGWQSGLLWLSIPCALALEGSRLVSWRWEMSSADMRRVVYLSNILFAGAMVYFFATTDRAHLSEAFMSLMQFIPLAIFPLIAAQAYSIHDRIDIKMLMLFRRSGSKEKETPGRLLNLSYPYFVICLLSAGASNPGTIWFYVGATILLGWALWIHRPVSYSRAVWFLLFALVWGSGYIGHIGLHRLQGTVEEAISSYYVNKMTRENADPFKSETAIGHIGDMKLSDKIILRVKADEGLKIPLLLYEASYNSYVVSTWFARAGGERIIRPEADGTTWKLADTMMAGRGMRISSYLEDGKGLLPLPSGSFRIENLPAGELRQTGLATVMVEDGPRVADFTIRYNPDTTHMSSPSEVDLRVPKNLVPVFSRVVKELKLKEGLPGQAVQMVEDYFGKNFQYSTFQKERVAGTEPLADFLNESRSGHCEYFATATVLLLRAAGIPARYATGYLVNEFSPWEKAYVVRSRHAHAWTLAYIDGVWKELDTTPPVWFEEEQKTGQGMRWLSDLWSWASFQFTQWNGKEEMGKYAGWLLVPFIAVLVWRLLRIKRVKGSGKRQITTPAVSSRNGEDSEFYLVERKLVEMGFSRHPWEPLSVWIGRLRADQRIASDIDSLQKIISLHYQYRFDPKGISESERKALKSDVRAWLANTAL